MELSVGGRHRRALFSSARGDWRTPREVFRQLNAEFHFTCDVAASAQNHLCDSYFDEAVDGLGQAWVGVCYCNPPYGRAVGKWVAKAADSTKDGTTTVMLLPSRTDTKWFHDIILPRASEIRFIPSRLYFDDNPNGRAPFPSMIVVFDGKERLKQEQLPL